MQKHPNKHIKEAIEYALDNGWEYIESGNSGHSFCKLHCPLSQRGGCIIHVWSTPRNPEDHAKSIIKEVNKCEHEKNI